MTLVFAYFVFVLLGPLVFLALIRPAPSVGRFAIGCSAAMMLTVAAWSLQNVGPNNAMVAIGWLTCVWLGWIVTIAMVVQAVALKRGFGRYRKWSASMGAVATVLPWFGLSLALSAAG